MCGINGFIEDGNKDPGAIGRMNEATAHRGPDGTGTFSDGPLSLGHNLLAIADTPENGRQPFLSPDRAHALVYNGEIYNYRALRMELEAEGERFHTAGDTEVLFKGLIRHGAAFLEKLDGMFALAFYDKHRGTLLLARDAAGMKPLYYAEQGSSFVFSSEIRGLMAYQGKPLLNREAAKLFFLFGYVPTNETLFSGVRKLPPGAALTIRLSTQEKKRERFGWKNRSDEAPFDAEGLRKKINTAVSEHTMGLRPFGLFLSGGLDSTIILHELSKASGALVKTYTTRFDAEDPRYNEDADLAKRLTGDYRIDHHELVVTERMFMDHYEDAISAMEEPRYNHSVPAYWLLSQMAAKDITVVLNGSGGDELFLGYPRYLTASNLEEKYRCYPAFALDAFYSMRAVRDGLIAPGRLLHLGRPMERWAYISKIMAFRFMDGFDMKDALSDLFRSDAPPVADPLPDATNAIAELDRYFWLANEEFMRTDKIIMHFGMEGRFPLLARGLVRTANGIPSAEKLKGGPKSLLRAAYRGALPAYILEKQKTGWNAPVTEWMRGAFGDMVSEILSPSYYPETAALFDFNALKCRELGKDSYTLADLKRFLPIVQFQVWARAFRMKL
jgi:asparagine synthase (glutamine-hydrolysing)